MKAISYSTYAADTIKSYIESINKEIPGVRSQKNIEYLHRMRIASRRLRTAFKVFSPLFIPSELAIWKKETQKLGRSLGKSRERDVQIRLLQSLKASRRYSYYLKSILRIHQFLKKSRNDAQIEVEIALKEIEKQKTFNQILKHVHALRTDDSQKSKAAFLFQSRELILSRLRKFFSYKRYVKHPSKNEELHKMRIAAKNLRYTLEILDPVFEKKLSQFALSAKSIQDRLGDLHEFDVWIAMLPKFKEGRGSEEKDGIVMLSRYFSMCRKQSYKRFLNTFNTLNAKKTWTHLTRAL